VLRIKSVNKFFFVHVIIGTIFLSVALWRVFDYHLTDNHHVGLEGGILYWHFVDVVWLFRAPLWIFDGRVASYNRTTHALTRCSSIIGEDTKVATKPCNPYGLPKLEMREGPEHAIKAMNVIQIIGCIARKIYHGLFVTLCRAHHNLLSIGYVLLISGAGDTHDIVARGRQIVESRPKIEKAVKESTAGSPKGSNSYGDGALIVVRGVRVQPKNEGGQRFYSTSATTASFSARDLLSKLEVLDGKYSGLHKLVYSEELLFAAYWEIKSKPGNMTPGSDEETLDGVSQELLRQISREIKDSSFKFKPVRREWIPKANGKMRPLGIPSPRDKIVQKAMAILLEIIYEQEFVNESHGFRPGRGCHTALAQLNQWKGIRWAIEGDIKGFFDNVDHEILMKLLEKKISDQSFLRLVRKLIKAGYVEEGVKRDSILGVPQGGIISPILSNIYLHEFDKFVLDLIDKYSTKEKKNYSRNPEYDRKTRRIQYLRDKYPKVSERPKDVQKEIERLLKERAEVPATIPKNNRVKYVRYADDWMIGVFGPVNLAVEIRDMVAQFLQNELKLELSLEKTKITDLYHDKAAFLGYYLRINKPSEQRKLTIEKYGHKRKVRSPHVVMLLEIPHDKIIKKLIDGGFVRIEEREGKSKYIPLAKAPWTQLDHRSILNRYNWISRGLCNYYGIANNRWYFHLIINYILRHSCAKTLALKYKLGARSRAFDKFGNDLATKEEPVVSFYSEPNYKWNPTKIIQEVNKTPFDVLNWSLRTQWKVWDACIICGSDEKVEMHHVKHIRKEGQKVTGFTKIMSRLNRKQVPVCQECHIKIHNGEYDGMSIKDLAKRRRNNP
jgi:group II intron reverse transcriptase/maturase